MNQIRIRAAGGVDAAIAAIGRTEDVHFSPSNRRLAVAGFRKNSILILSIRRTPDEAIDIDSALTVECGDFSFPHGVFWLSEERLAVANRGSVVAIVDVPDRHNTAELQVAAPLVVRNDDIDLLAAPGSVFARRVSKDLTELLVCNNSGHYVSRHLAFTGGGTMATVSSDIVAEEGLGIPDGITCDRAYSFAAVSNHNDHSVYVYRTGDFGPRAQPRAVLRGMSYPHGLRFTPDSRSLLVADAGQPFVHIFHSPEGTWDRDAEPVNAIRVVDQDTFLRGRHNEQEGGPKGIDITQDGKVLVVSCHEQPLAFFELEEWLAGTPSISVSADDTPPTESYLIARLAGARRQIEELRNSTASPSAAPHRSPSHAQLQELEQTLDAIRQSTSWRVTAPLRWLARRLRGGAG